MEQDHFPLEDQRIKKSNFYIEVIWSVGRDDFGSQEVQSLGPYSFK